MVTVVVQPSGTVGAVVCEPAPPGPDGGFVTVAVAVAVLVPGQYVVVYVVVTVVKPVGQISM
jgi:hypothetical protein